MIVDLCVYDLWIHVWSLIKIIRKIVTLHWLFQNHCDTYPKMSSMVSFVSTPTMNSQLPLSKCIWQFFITISAWFKKILIFSWFLYSSYVLRSTIISCRYDLMFLRSELCLEMHTYFTSSLMLAENKTLRAIILFLVSIFLQIFSFWKEFYLFLFILIYERSNPCYLLGLFFWFFHCLVWLLLHTQNTYHHYFFYLHFLSI